MDVNIKKIKFGGDASADIEYTYTKELTMSDGQPEDVKRSVAAKLGTKAHPDFLAAMKKLRVHLAHSTEQLGVSATAKNPAFADWANNEEKLKNYIVTGVTFTGGKKDGDAGVVITGYKKLNNGLSPMNFNTPNIFTEKPGISYPWIGNLVNDLKTIREEAIEYAFNDKRDQSGEQMGIFEEKGTQTVDDVLKSHKDPEEVF